MLCNGLLYVWREREEMLMRVKEVVDLVGISVCILYYYDVVGLLILDEIIDLGYCFYFDENLEIL